MADDTTVDVLRDLPGVMEIERLLVAAQARQNPKWCEEYEAAQKLAEAVSRRLFGITDTDTRFVKNHLLQAYENEHNSAVWERDFSFLSEPWQTQAPQWAELEWDVSDGAGAPLLCLELLGRQIVAASIGRAGHLPDEDQALSEQDEQDIEARLRAEAAKFRPDRGR